ncbi:MAG: gamma-glutamyl-gamma-aminobutyrate hydrolase family protein, partial [Pseudomonadota bacterium]
MVRDRRPLIGITRSAHKGWAMTWLNRLAVWRAGGRSIVVSARRRTPLPPLDGLVIGGGEDIAPSLSLEGFGATIEIDRERDRLELELLHLAGDRRLPVLGICRGAQMINVHRGGTLHVDIYERYVDARRLRTVLPRKAVSIRPDSRLARIIGREATRVNALHHQSVDRLGEGLAVAAVDEVGMVQAVEDASVPFCVGVQWHPEMLVWQQRQQRLFR